MTHIISLLRGSTTIKCLNIQQFFPVSVKKMGDTLGLPKYDIDFRIASDERLLTYCHRDTEIISTMFGQWLDYLSDKDLGRLAITLASQAMTTFRYKFLTHKIYIHNNPILSEYERASYHGGRVEIFRRGKIVGNSIYKLDINSMYPYIMQKYPMPVEVKGVEYHPKHSKIKELIHKYYCIARVAVDTPTPVYPMVHNNRLIFPIGKYITTLSQPELIYAYKQGHIASMHSVYYYDTAPIFNGFVDFFYNERQTHKRNNDITRSYCAKILMNSLYGKFGQRRDIEIANEYVDDEEYVSRSVYVVDSNKTYREVILGYNRMVYEEKADIAKHTFYAIASAVTAYARMYLWEIMSLAGLHNVYYVDTDAIFTNREGFRNVYNLIDSRKLGMLDIEEKTHKLILHGAKDYQFGGKKVIKGIRRDAEKLSNCSYKQTQFPGFRGDLQHGLDKPYSVMDITKTLTREYTKGNINAWGFVEPFVLEEF